MGQKAHPIGLRVGIIRDTDSKWYLPPRQFSDALYEDYKIRRFFKKNPKLANAAISKIEIERAGNRIKATLHTAKPGIIIGRQGQGVDDLKAQVEKHLKKPANTVHISVQEIRHPDVDAQLVAESIAQQIEKRVAYKRAMRQAVLRAMKLGIKGIRIMCAGRLAGSEMARREGDRQGKIPLQTLRADIDYGFAEAITSYSVIGIKVWIYKGDVLPGQPRQTEVEQPRQGREGGRGERGGRGEGRGGRGEGGRGGDRGGRGEGGGRGGDRGPRPEGGGGDRGPRPEGGGGDRGPRGPRPEGGGGDRGPRGEGGRGPRTEGGGPRPSGYDGGRPEPGRGERGQSGRNAGGGPSGTPGGGGPSQGEARGDRNNSGRQGTEGRQDQRADRGPGGAHPNDTPPPAEPGA